MFSNSLDTNVTNSIKMPNFVSKLPNCYLIAMIKTCYIWNKTKRNYSWFK